MMRKNKSSPKRPINALDFFVLIHAVMASIQDKNIEWNHASKTYQTWFRDLSGLNLEISKEHLEDALYSANLLNEKDKFYHPYNKLFNNFVKSLLLPGEKFDKISNIIVKEDANV